MGDALSDVPECQYHFSRIPGIRVSVPQTNALVADLSGELSNDGVSRSVGVRTVKTYVESGRSKSAIGIYIPPFASHWGVVVGKWLFHLCFVDPSDAELQSRDFSRSNSPVRFKATPSYEY